ncbi:MAG: LPS assembly lipoprotein LptE [Gammaproteobacteria bacterium]
MRRILKSVCTLLVPMLMLTACGGWHLRGTSVDGGLTHRVYIRDANSNYVGDAVRREIVNRGGQVTRSRAQAEIVVDIEGERYERRILSVDQDTGKVREIELGLGAVFAVRTVDGRLLVPREEITWELDYVFDEGSVLGSNEQDNIIRRDLAEVAATAIVLRLQATEVPEPVEKTPKTTAAAGVTP